MEKINKESATEEFERFADVRRIDLELEDMDENDARDTSGDVKKIVRAIMSGYIVIDTDANLIFTPEFDEDDSKGPITFGTGKGSAWVVTDKKKPSQEVGKIFASMGEYTRQSPNRFSKMDGRDLKVCLAVYTLLMV